MAQSIPVRPSVVTYGLGEDNGYVELSLDSISFKSTVHSDQYEQPISIDINLTTADDRGQARYILEQMLDHIDIIDNE